MKKYIIILTIISLFIPIIIQADESKPKDCCNNYFIDPKDVKWTGYIDGSYNYLANSNQFISGVNDRVFDLNENGFTLQQASVTLSVLPKEGIGFVITPLLGRDAFTTASYGFNPDIEIHNVGFDMLQTYLQFSAGSFTLIAGKFNTLANYEVTDPTQDTNFSRSILFGNEPYTHTGIRGTYVFSDQFKLIAGVNNGWDNIRDTSRQKTVELGAVFTPCSLLSLAIAGYSGQQRAQDFTSCGPIGRRNLIDVVGILNATKKLSFVIDYGYANQDVAALPNDTFGEARWQGIVGYINYKFNDCWRISLRGEDFDDPQGYRTGIPQNIIEGTFTLGYAPFKNFELRAETRRDRSNVNSYKEKNGCETRNYQQSFGLEAYWKF